MSPWEGAGALAEEGDFNDYPADLYLQAKDLIGTHQESAIEVVKGQRSALFRKAEAKIRNMQLAVGSARTFDRTGHAGEALGHIEATFRDVKRAVTLLVEDIEGAEAGYLENLRERRGEHGTKQAGAAVEPSPEAPAAPADDSSPASPLAGEETGAGVAVAPIAAAPVAPMALTNLPAGLTPEQLAAEIQARRDARAEALADPQPWKRSVPKPGPGLVNVPVVVTVSQPVAVADAVAVLAAKGIRHLAAGR